MNKIINPVEDELKKKAVEQPHGFVYVDKVLNIKTDGFGVQVTFGWETPNGAYSPVVTAAMPVPFAEHLAQTLLKAVRDAKEQRKRNDG